MEFPHIINKVETKKEHFQTLMDKMFVAFLTQFPLAKCHQRSEQHFYHQKLNVRVVSHVTKGLKTNGLTNLENLKKITEKVGIDGKSSTCPKTNFR